MAPGASPEGVVLFRMLLLAQAQRQHSDPRRPDGLDRLLRRMMVTPDTHRVHRSVVRQETDANFATVLSLWDRNGVTLRRVRPGRPSAAGCRHTASPRRSRGPGCC
ncbi:MAG: hypothetical protein HY423_00630 [Candidatus Lambdaproteobacteria bacterium]|nr:hypothetical protein [Candidatus Lambdaproteobacteria bacterium]